MKWELHDLASVGDLATYFYVGKPTVSNWTKRYEDFPAPLIWVANDHIALYSLKAVVTWYESKQWKNDGPGTRKN